MWHAHNDVPDAVIDRAVNESLHTRNKRFTSFKAESLLVGVLGGNELFEHFRPHKAIKDHALVFDRVIPRVGHLYALSDPVALLLVGDMDILIPDSSAYDFCEHTGVVDSKWLQTVYPLAGSDDIAESH